MSLLLLLAIPLVAALLTLLPGRSWFAPSVTIASASAVLALSVMVSAHLIAGHPWGGIPGWVGSDGLSSLILLVVAYVGWLAAIFSWGYMERLGEGGLRPRLRVYYTNFNLFLLALLAVPLMSELALVWIAVELTTLLSILLVSFEGGRESLEAAWKYAVLAIMGGTMALFGFVLLYWALKASGGSVFSWQGLLQAAPQAPPDLLKAAFVLILIGFGTKIGFVPLHTWLPDAHSQAPSPICALLSGVKTSAALYVVLRLLPVVNASPSLHLAPYLTVFGLLSVGTAAFLLIQVSDYKRLFAYSTVEHMGIILTAAGLGGSAAFYGSVYQILSHSLTKSFSFLAAGAALLVLGTRRIAGVRGLIRASPAAGAALLLAGLAIAGAPPFVVFLSELSIFKAGLANGQYLVIALLVLFIAVAFFAVLFQLNRLVFGPSNRPKPARLPASVTISLLLGALPIVIFGVYLPAPLQKLLQLAAASLGR